MLQANLAIILTFITTLIDELAETENLSNAKLAVIALAFITVIVLFNFYYKEDKKSNPINDIDKKLSMLTAMPSQMQNMANTGLNQIQNMAKTTTNQLSSIANNTTNQLSQVASNTTNQLSSVANNASQQINNTIATKELNTTTAKELNTTANNTTQIPSVNNNGLMISSPPSPPKKEGFNNRKYHSNNSTQLMSEYFRIYKKIVI